jgi:hypothetical protein
MQFRRQSGPACLDAEDPLHAGCEGEKGAVLAFWAVKFHTDRQVMVVEANRQADAG